MNLCRAGWSAVVVAGAALPFASDASGQGSPILPETRSIHGRAALALSARSPCATWALDSNVFNDVDGTEGRLHVFADADAVRRLPIGNTRFVGRGFGDLVYYRTYKNQRVADDAVATAAMRSTSPGFRPFVVGRLRRASASATDTRSTREPVRRQTTVTVGTDMDMTPVTAVTAWAIRTSTRWDDDDALSVGVNLAESAQHTCSDIVAGGARFRLTPLTTLSMAAEVQRDRFERLATARRRQPADWSRRCEFDSTAAISGHVTADYRSFKPLAPAWRASRPRYVQRRLRYTIPRSDAVELDAKRDMDYSFDPLHPYALQSGGCDTSHTASGWPARIDRDRRAAGSPASTARREVRSMAGARSREASAAAWAFSIRQAVEVRARLRTDFPDVERAGGRDYERTRLFGFVGYGQ